MPSDSRAWEPARLVNCFDDGALPNEAIFAEQRQGLLVSTSSTYSPAVEPEDLARFFVERANAGDVDGLVALYEPTAVLALKNGKTAVGSIAIRKFYADLLASRPQFVPGVQAPALQNGDIALTSSRLPNSDVTAEIARRQPDGTWLWIVDQPAIGS